MRSRSGLNLTNRLHSWNRDLLCAHEGDKMVGSKQVNVIKKNQARKLLAAVCQGQITDESVAEFVKILESGAQLLAVLASIQLDRERESRKIQGIPHKPRLAAHHIRMAHQAAAQPKILSQGAKRLIANLGWSQESEAAD